MLAASSSNSSSRTASEYRACSRADAVCSNASDHRDTRLQGALGGPAPDRDVDLDGILLTDTIQSADTLFQQIR